MTKTYSREEKLKFAIPYKWKIQSVSQTKPKAQCVAYVDARDVMDLLDRAVGYENWKDEYVFANNQWLCGLSIRTENGEWVTKWDTGTAGNFEAEKGAISDAFKRSAVKWGVGRFLYDLKVEWVDTNKPGSGAYPVFPHSQERIWDLTEYINSKYKNQGKVKEPAKEVDSLQVANEFEESL